MSPTSDGKEHETAAWRDRRPAWHVNHWLRPGPAALNWAAPLLACLLAGCETKNAYVEPPPPRVTAATPIRRPVTSYVEYTGTTQAIERVELRARVKGFLKQRLFQEGATVKAGQLLLVIDEEPFQVQLDQARARLAEAEAALRKAEESRAREIAQSQLALDQAQLVLSQIDEVRSRALYTRNAASREDLDKAEATRKKNEAQVESDRSHVEQAKADYETGVLSARANIKAAANAVRSAEIDLGYCRVTAPITGRITKTEVDVGNLVGDGQATVLATIVKTDPIYVYMYVSESDLLRSQKGRKPGKSSDPSEPALELEMGMGNEEGFPHKGRVDYTDPGVDPGTGTIRVRGIFPNPDGSILPGLFVRVRGAVETKNDALLVPSRALAFDQAGDYVLVVGKDNLVERRQVRLGETAGDLRVVEGSVGPQDLVIVDGLLRARPGFPVTSGSADQAPADARPPAPTKPPAE